MIGYTGFLYLFIVQELISETFSGYEHSFNINGWCIVKLNAFLCNHTFVYCISRQFQCLSVKMKQFVPYSFLDTFGITNRKGFSSNRIKYRIRVFFERTTTV